eukprot:TRINITY_DN4019_c0_g1_i1.p1 TRINITY_DN4019_c0_g1~~TRINITY_DN4019_c0_g1_i1.p1  ORF type:complete len:355 (+),score=96.49 TRINITY_DN4019_c0_g1_i1:1-1065(+)
MKETLDKIPIQKTSDSSEHNFEDFGILITKNKEHNQLLSDLIISIKEQNQKNETSVLDKLIEIKLEDCESICEELIKSVHFYYAVEWRLFRNEANKSKIYEWLFVWYIKESPKIDLFVKQFIPALVWAHLYKNSHNIEEIELDTLLLGMDNHSRKEEEIIQVLKNPQSPSIYTTQPTSDKISELLLMKFKKFNPEKSSSVSFSNREAIIRNLIDKFVAKIGKMPQPSVTFFCLVAFQASSTGYPFASKTSPCANRVFIALDEKIKIEKNNKLTRRVHLNVEMIQSFLNGLVQASVHPFLNADSINAIRMIYNRAVYHTLPQILLTTNAFFHSFAKDQFSQKFVNTKEDLKIEQN